MDKVCNGYRHHWGIAIIALSLMLHGCSLSQPSPPTSGESSPIDSNLGVNKASAAAEQTVQVFFPDKEYYRLVPVERAVNGSEEEKIKQLFAMLVEGPKNDQLSRIVPAAVKLNKATIHDRTLELDLSKEITQLNTGSAGESMLVGSIVNSFCTMGYASIKLTVEGKSVESLAGHVDVSGPLNYFDELTVREGPIPAPANVGQIQREVDRGLQTWRLDPVEVARLEGIALGFLPDKDSFGLVSRNDSGASQGVAKVKVRHGKLDFLVELFQPTGAGEKSFWAIRSVSSAPIKP
ncbi:hypothetical protein GJ688_06420 [Heliobacillus mobilis]|uniref:GerMN domain-containing protein n=1 Tax=Heliobacterium mobile TaxID=28064 RepID=A0A6I3SI93_HELMO|nr:GerMN domain-containing protein [Heliobacterium mobile]MTV48613.1 hypothetical protein [Heliobacterium mobile]